MEYLAGLMAKKITCRAFKENAPSVRLIEKLGFKKSGESENQYFFTLSLGGAGADAEGK